MSHPRVDVCLSTHQGARFVVEQVESVVRQSHEETYLLIRDDGSTDQTRSLLSQLAQSYPEKIALVDEGGGRLGISASYSRLMAASDAGYLMLCDQDDVWDSRKVEISLEKLRTMENSLGADHPLLVHTDLRVVDADLQLIEPSLWRHQKLDPRAAESFSRLLVHNVVTGCATLFNRALVQLALPVPAEAVMHDWWLALVAAAFGAIGFVPEATSSYRQHPDNVYGAEEWSVGHAAAKAVRVADRSDLLSMMARCSRQAEAFLQRHGERLEPGQHQAVSACSNLMSYGFLRRRTAILRNGLFKVGLARNLSMLMRI